MKNQTIYLLSYVIDDGYDGGVTEEHITTSFDLDKLSKIAEDFITKLPIYFDRENDIQVKLQKQYNTENLHWREFSKTTRFDLMRNDISEQIEKLQFELFDIHCNFAKGIYKNNLNTAEFSITELSVI